MQRKTQSKILCSLLATCILFSSIPTMVFADDGSDNVITTETSALDASAEESVEETTTETENTDENVESIPTDDSDSSADVTEEIEEPPIEETIETTTDTSDETTDTTPVEETTAEETDVTTEETEETEEIEPVYEYSVTLPEDTSIYEGDTISISANIVATVTTIEEDEEVTNEVDYSFEFLVNDEFFTDSTVMTYTFSNVGTYTITGNLLVDGEVVASDSMNVNVNPGFVEFDHYFTEIDESLVQTTELFVQTSNSSVFTRNTNVISRFDDVYIISFDDVQTARYAYSYYVDKVDNITDLSQVMSIATDENGDDVADMSNVNNGADAISNLNDISVQDYSGYIALIDTGAPDAAAQFSVIGDDLTDYNGHGTAMYNYILEENPNAQVMSIKVFDGSSANAADVYAGIRLAIDSNVSVINLSFVGADLERNAIVKDIIQEAIDRGIVVIGAAGNYNLDATQFIPGCIEGVITVGAANADGTKYGSSNFNADLYVIATSTSEATARYTGIYTAGIESDKVFYNLDQSIEYDSDVDPEEIAALITARLRETYGYGQVVVVYNADGSWSLVYDFSDALYNDEFYLAASRDAATRDLDNITNKPFFDSGWSGTETGTCSYDNAGSGNRGQGTITLNGHGNVSVSSGSPVYLSDYTSSFTAVCSRWFGESDSTHAPWLRENQTIYYRASYHTETFDSGAKIRITWTVDISNRSDFSQPDWSSESLRISWRIYTESQGTSANPIWYAVVNGREIYHSTITPSMQLRTDIINAIEDEIADIAAAELDEFGGVKNVSSSGTWPTSIRPGESGTVTYTWNATNEQQVFRAEISGWRWNYVYLDLNKTGFDLCSFTAGNPNYSLAGVTFEVRRTNGTQVGTIEITGDDHNGNLTYRFTSNPYGTEIVSDDKLSLSHELAGQTLLIVETHGGINYSWAQNNTTMVTVGQPGTTTTVNVQNIPQGDPVQLQLTKNSDINGGTDYNGNIDPSGAIYTVYYYYNSSDASPARVMTYSTNSDGFIHFGNASQCTSGNYFTDNNGHISWPVGHYVIRETQVPTTSSIERGLQLSSRYWTIDVWTGIDNNTPGNKEYITIIQYNPDGSTETIADAAIAGENNISLIDAVDSIDIENEIWEPIGLVKIDTERYAHGQEYSRPQGDASLAGAQFQLLTNDTTIFDYLPNHTYGGHTYYVGSAVTGGYYSILVDGAEIVVTTADDGYAVTSVSLPYGTCYAWREIVAPEGYILDQTIYPVSERWTINNGQIVPLDHNVANGGVYENVAYAVVGNRRNGMIPDSPYRGQIRVVKHDFDFDYVGVTNDDPNAYANGEAQGDASLAGIRYAIVNRSERSIFYTPTGTEYEPNQVVVILTTDEYGKCQTPDNALPYGTYDIYELRQDATIQPGEVYDGSNKLGVSIYSNGSYLFSEGYARSTVRTTATTDVEVQGFELRTDGQVINSLFDNEVISGTLEIWKYNTETRTNLNQGNNNLVVDFAVVNRSANRIELHENDETSLGVFEPGQIIAIVTTSENGHAILENIPYGTYDVYELRRDHTLEVGDYYDNSSAKYGSEDYANTFYLYDEQIGDPYSVTAPQRFVVRREQGTTYTQVWNNTPLRGDFEIKKYNEDGYPMPYIPFLVQLLATDENGQVLRDPTTNEYIVIEEHVILTDATGHFNSQTGTRNQSQLNTLDQYYDGHGNYTGPVDGAEAAAAAQSNVWFGVGGVYGSERYNNNAWNEYPNLSEVLTTTGRGSLLYGQYRVEELNCTNNTGTTMIERQFMIDADHQFYDATRIQIDIHTNILTVATDVNTDSNSLSYGTAVTVQDEVQLINIRYKDENGNVLQYRIDTEVYLHDPNVTTDQLIATNEHIFDATQINPATNITTQTETIQFQIDSTQCPEGSYIYFVNYLYEKIDSDWATTPIKVHNDDDSVDTERLYVPTINTDAINNTTLTNVASMEPHTVVTDDIEFVSLPNKMLGDLTIQLVDDNGNVVTDINGNACTWSSFIYVLDSAGYDDWNYVSRAYGQVLTGPTTGAITMDELGVGPWTIPTRAPGESVHFQIIVESTLSGETICYDNVHLDDNNEAIRWLKVWSSAGSEIGDQGMIPQDENSVIVETIFYENLAEDVTIRVDGKIYDVTNGVDSAELVLEQTFYQDITRDNDEGSGQFDITFNPINTLDKANHRYVVVENIYMEVNGQDVLIAEHNIMDDDLETVYVPDVRTTLYNSHDVEYKVVSETYADVTLVDHVAYTNVRPGTELQMTATLMDVNTQQPVRDASGNIVTNTVTFVPPAESGVVDVPLTFTQVIVARDWEADDAWVCYENMQSSRPGHTDFNYVVHNDINDKDQTIYHPAFRTTVANTANGTQYIQSLPNQTVTDTVELRNFEQAVETGDIFTLVIEAHDAETGNPILDANGNVYTNSKTFVWNGQTSETIDLTFDATGLEGSVVVFYETLYYGTHTSGDEHKVLEEVDRTNAAQSVIVVGAQTTASDKTTDTNIITAQRIIVDDIYLYGITPDTDYIIATRLVDQATGEFITKADGSEYIVYTEYHSPAHSDDPTDDLVDINGNVIGVTTYATVEMDINGTTAPGKTVVVFERVFTDLGVVPEWTSTPIASHEDINDDFQTVIVPDIHTNAMDKNDGDKVLRAADGVQTIVDTVTYTNLIPGEEYTVTGVLVFKSAFDSDGNPEYVLYNGEKVTGETTFTASATGSGTVEVEFTFDASPYAGRSAVVFETLMFEDIEVVVHADINDEAQTVVITGEQPEISTSVRDAADGDNVVAGGENQTIIDTVEYHNLVPGQEYTMTCELVVSTGHVVGEPYTYVVDKNGNIVTATISFTPTSTDGTVEVPLTFDASNYASKQLVCFETCRWLGLQTVAEHKDINDFNQTFYVSSVFRVRIAKADANNISYMLSGAEITIFNEDGTIATDVNGNQCVGLTDANGIVEFVVVNDGTHTYYAQETKAPAGYNINPDKFAITPVSEGASYDSDGALLIPITILDTIIVIPPKTGDNFNMGLWIALAVLAVLGVAGGTFYMTRNKKKNSIREVNLDSSDAAGSSPDPDPNTPNEN